MKSKFAILKNAYKDKTIDYDIIYDFFEGWFAYAKHANTHKLRKKFAVEIESFFPNEVSTKEINRTTKNMNCFYYLQNK